MRLHGQKPWMYDFDLPEDAKFLDIGAGHRPHPKATHVIDFAADIVNPQRHGHQLNIRPNIEYKFNGVPEGLKDYPDKFFDFCYSSHCIEHIVELEETIKEISRTCKRGFFIFPASDMEFLMGKHKAGHVNMLRERGDEILWSEKPLLATTDRMGHLWEQQVYNHPEFYSFVEGSHKFIWECRYYWEGAPKFRKVDIEEIYPQIKYFK